MDAPSNTTGTNRDALFKGHLKELEVTLTSPCEEYPHLDMDESCKYNIIVRRLYYVRSLTEASNPKSGDPQGIAQT